MTKYTRRLVLAALGVAVGSTSIGCLTRTRESRQTPADEPVTTERLTPTSTPDETPTAYWIERASNAPDPNKPIYVRGRDTDGGTVRVQVVREATGETVHDQRHPVVRGRIEVYNLRDAEPDGVERFSVCAKLVPREKTDTATTETTTATDDTNTAATDAVTTSDSDPGPRATSDCSSIETNECYGTLEIVIDDDGQLRTQYSIC
ncbi:hypothetical protein [Haloprofundus salilacus]|uniref:hypothetical protein n=1 Tax=Haloprofundus salilacus TaxID=2876190 RepID=UPI001CCE76EE|nr:hypothetical protein [Haloprofundus salilacus]